MKTILFVPLLAIAFASSSYAQVKVEEPWVRATVGSQTASGAFMTLTSSEDARLVEVRTPVAGIAEIHEMALENNVMRMRAIDGVALPAGKAIELRPGGYHLMLMDLKAPLKAGDTVALTLTIQSAAGKRETVDVSATVRPLAGAGHGMKHGQ